MTKHFLHLDVIKNYFCKKKTEKKMFLIECIPPLTVIFRCKIQ